MVCCRVLQTLFVLILFCKCQCCIYELPQCRNNVVGLSLAEYEINSRNNRPVDQRVCFSTNTDEYNVNNLTLKITASTSPNGTFCTNVLLNETQGCAQNLSKTIMYFNLKGIVNNSGEIQVNFTRDGKDPVTFRIIFAPNGIYSLNNSTQLTVKPTNPVNLQWTIYSTQTIIYQHIDKTGMISSTRPGTFMISNITACIPPKSNSIMPRQPRLATVSVSSINIEDTGQFIMMDSQFKSSVNVTVEVDSNAPILDTGGTGANTMVTTAQVNQTKTLSCDIIGSSRSPSWYFNNVPLTSDGTYTITSTGLVITAVGIGQAGLYTCVASNKFGTTEKYISLIVGAAPQIIVPPPSSITIQNNTRVIIPCRASGLPPPNIQWFTNNIQIVNGMGGASIDPTTGALYFENEINLLKNIYCSVSNIFGMVNSSTTNINVLTNTGNFSGVFLPSPLVGPFITLGPTGFVELVCYNVTDNNLRFQWSKNNVNINSASSRLYTVNVNDSGSSWGIYCCSIYDTSSSIIDQRCVVVYIAFNATLQTGLTNISVRSGSSIFYYCSATTDNNIDPPFLSWYRNSNVLNEINPPRYSYHQNRSSLTTLMITNVSTSDEGMYTCRGNNNMNIVMTTAELRVVDTCGNNSLSNPSAEGDITQTRSSWSIPLNNPNVYISEGTAENHFVLNKTAGSTLSPFMRQTMTITDAGNYTLLFSCRMRSTAPESVKPIVNLTVPGVAMTTVSLTFSVDSWQWVSTKMSFILKSPGELSVAMELNEDAGSGHAVYFDDMCASLRSERLTNPSTTPTTSAPGIPTIYIIVGSGLFAILVCLCIFCCCCCCYYRKKRHRYEPEGQFKKKFTKDLATSVSSHYHKNNGTELLSLTKSSDEQSPTTLNTSDKHQPVYVIPGETPVYLDTPSSPPTNKEPFSEDDDYINPRTNSNVHLLSRPYERPQHQGTTSEIETTQSYDYPDLRQKPLSKVGSPHDQSNSKVFQSQRTSAYENPQPVVDIYEESIEMYDDPNKNFYDDPDKNSSGIEEVYDDPNKNSDVEDVYDIPDSKISTLELKPPIVPRVPNRNNVPHLRPLPRPSSNDNLPPSRPVAIPNNRTGSFSGSSTRSSFASVPLPPLPIENPTVIEDTYEDPRPQTPEPTSLIEDGNYMHLNPSSLQKHIYSSTNSLSKEDDNETEVEGEYLSITNQYLKVLDSNSERLKRLSLQEEGEYVT